MVKALGHATKQQRKNLSKLLLLTELDAWENAQKEMVGKSYAYLDLFVKFLNAGANKRISFQIFWSEVQFKFFLLSSNMRFEKFPTLLLTDTR